MNVRENVPPPAILPESQTAVSDVTVCVVAAALFVHVTVSPTLMFVVAGVNAKLLIVTEAEAAFALSKPLPSAPAMSATARTATPRIVCVLPARIKVSLPL